METYEITVSDKKTYIIRAASQEAAEEQACEWFSEREPDISVTVTDKEPEYILKY